MAKIKKICPNCNKEYFIFPSAENKYNFCSMECRKEYSTIKYNCDYCGKEFNVLKSKIETNTKGLYCSHKCSTDANIKGVHLLCENCGKKIYKMQSKIYKHNFCSNKCSQEYNHNLNKQEKECEYCHQLYIIKKSHAKDSRFCSNDCKNKWQSEFLIGENNPCFKSTKLKCGFCGKEIFVPPNRLNSRQNKFFCSYECTHKYYSVPKNRTSKQKEFDKIFAKNAIYTSPNHMTKPHKLINEYLDKENIVYRNEEIINYYKMDIYLSSNNLGIEINGDFWHCSPIRYNEIQYERQLKTIYKDKSKHTYVKNKYNYEILYLWENDIYKHFDVCEKLIQEYIKRNGILDNYHSFNYYIDNKNQLILNSNIIVPYQEQDIEEYRDKIQIKK